MEFSYKRDNSDKIILLNTVDEIEPNYKTKPVIMTACGEVIKSTSRIMIHLSLTKKGNPSLRIYPLKKLENMSPPSFVFIKNDNPIKKSRGTYICLETEEYAIVRPLLAVLRKAEWNISQRDIQWAASSIITLLRHCYFSDIIDDNFIDKTEKDFSRLEKIISRHESTTYRGEKRNCSLLALKICEKLLKKIKEVL